MPRPFLFFSAGIRHALGGLLTVSALGGGVLLALAPMSATAATDPCAASQIARTVGTVANNTGTYLDAHPQTNQALTTISQQQAGPQTLVALKTYFDANPQAAKELQAIQQPLTSLSGQCKLPVSLPQLLGLMQAAQTGGATPAQAAAVTPSTSSVSAVPVGSGPLPGPSASSTR